MQECEINPCVKQEYESELIPSTTGFNLVERMTQQTIPNQNTIYSNGDDLFVWDGEKYVPLVGRGCNLPLDIQLYGTWTGHLDEMVYENENVSEVIDTGINIKEAPSDLIYFILTIECDGEYAEGVDLVADRVWSGVTLGVFGRDGREDFEGQIFTAVYYSYRDTFNPQDVNDLDDHPLTAGVGITLLGSGQTVRFVRSVRSGSYYTKRIMGGNYTVNVYGLKLGNFQ